MNLKKSILMLFVVAQFNIAIEAKERFVPAAKGTAAAIIAGLALASTYQIGKPQLDRLVNRNTNHVDIFQSCAALCALYVGIKLGKYAYESLNKALED